MRSHQPHIQGQGAKKRTQRAVGTSGISGTRRPHALQLYMYMLCMLYVKVVKYLRAPRSLRPIWDGGQGQTRPGEGAKGISLAILIVRVLLICEFFLRGRQSVGGKQKRNQRSMHSLFSASGARKSKHTLPNEREGFALAVGASMQRRRHAGGGNAQRAV